MAIETVKKGDATELSVEEKLKLLYSLQKVHSSIDNIKTLRGELPLEVQDLEDEIEGLETRIGKLKDEVKEFETAVTNKKNEIKESEALIKKYKEQQNNVRNNREYDSLSKEIEYQTLEIELCEKRIKEFSAKVVEKNEQIKESEKTLTERKDDLVSKKEELEEIVDDTKKEEETLANSIGSYENKVDERLLTAFNRIRKSARNGLAVVTVQRDACGGCFNKIPPQRQLDIKSRKKIIVCEYCGRILVDDELTEEEAK